MAYPIGHPPETNLQHAKRKIAEGKSPCSDGCGCNGLCEATAYVPQSESASDAMTTQEVEDMEPQVIHFENEADEKAREELNRDDFGTGCR